jgi:hypothetical protein
VACEGREEEHQNHQKRAMQGVGVVEEWERVVQCHRREREEFARPRSGLVTAGEEMEEVREGGGGRAPEREKGELLAGAES